ncbi:hypothetical protein MRB53_017419 [Persea americana]|uniref:Uncharacterized protein n=1 Tax=Persea americana TaxID=3435 RepID=A0ACC2M534_PERAE|nr:hypothetical protein MRB53_017419 [Persea americana]
MEVRNTRYAIDNTLDSQLNLSFYFSSSCLVFSELIQASECLRLTAARGSDPSCFPSFSGSWRSVFPYLQSSSQSNWVSYFHRLQVGAVCGELNKKLTNTMTPKTRNGEGPSKGKGPSIQPVLVQSRPPPRQRSSHVHERPKKQRQIPEDEEELKQWIDRKVKQTIRQNMEIAGIARDQYSTFEAEDTGASPFSRKIKKKNSLPEKFNFPSLEDLPLQWFCSLPEGSIYSWRQLRTSFLEKFQAHRVISKTDADLMALQMREDDNVTQFASRFRTVYRQIECASKEMAAKPKALGAQ